MRKVGCLFLLFGMMQILYAEEKMSLTCMKNKLMEDTIQVQALPDYPIKGGVSGMFAGVHQDKLIVAGGCNFPHTPAAEGGEKVFYKEVYWMDISEDASESKWVKGTPLPFDVAYGSSVTAKDGIVCLGGQNKKKALTDVLLIQFDTVQDKITHTRLPSLPVSHFNGGAAVYEEIVYVTGGSFGDQSKGVIYSLDLNNKEKGWKRIEGNFKNNRQQPVVVAQDSSLLLVGGYDEFEGEAYTDMIRFDFRRGQWEAYLPIAPNDDELKTFVGATGLACGADEILFVGGVNYYRFDAALKRLKKTDKAAQEGDMELLAELKKVGKEYMSQRPDWYRFNRTLSVFNSHEQRWFSLGDYEEVARAGAGIVGWDDNLYVICGEIKPGVRTSRVSCLSFEI